MIDSLLKRTGPAPGSQLAKAVGLALATLATSSAFAVPVFPGTPQTAVLMVGSPINGDVVAGTDTATAQSQPAIARPLSSGKWYEYYAFKVDAPADQFSVSVNKSAPGLAGLSGNVYLAGNCTATATTVNWQGTNSRVSCSPATSWSALAMTVTTAGLLLNYPSTGLAAVAAPQWFMVEVMGTTSTRERFTVNAASLQPASAPAVLGLLGIGLMGMGLTRRRKDAVPA